VRERLGHGALEPGVYGEVGDIGPAGVIGVVDATGAIGAGGPRGDGGAFDAAGDVGAMDHWAAAESADASKYTSAARGVVGVQFMGS
jgi:hypothetical protein